MKNSPSNVKFLVILGIFIVLITRCSDSNEPTTEEKLIANWTISQSEIDSKVGTQSLVDYLVDQEGYSPTDAAVTAGVFENSLKAQLVGTITFKSDHTYTQTIGGAKGGVWTLSTDGKIITLDAGTSDETVLTIKSISAKTLVVMIIQEVEEDLDDDDTTPDVTITAEVTITLTS